MRNIHGGNILDFKSKLCFILRYENSLFVSYILWRLLKLLGMHLTAYSFLLFLENKKDGASLLPVTLLSMFGGKKISQNNVNSHFKEPRHVFLQCVLSWWVQFYTVTNDSVARKRVTAHGATGAMSLCQVNILYLMYIETSCRIRSLLLLRL